MAKTAKPKAPAKKYPWQIEAEKRGQEIAENVAMLRDGSDEYLVGIAREALHHYHAAMMACDKPGRLPYELVIEACVETLYRIERYGYSEDGGNGTRYTPATCRSRFNCWNSASAWLGKQLAAPDGEIPMHGQPGRFMLTIQGCRTDVRYPGVFGGAGLDGRVIDLDRPFFSETGFRSFTGGGLSRERWFVDEAMPVDEMLTIVMEQNLLIDHHGKTTAKCKLHNPPFGLAYWEGNKRHDADDSRLREERRNDPAYQPGGFIAALPGLRSLGVASRQEASGQFAFAF